MDALRGIAILLVVLAHALAIPAILGFRVPDYLLRFGEFFLPFRMPALMLLSGLLLPRALAKGLPLYYLGKVQFLVWPYLVWAALHIAQGGVAYPLDDPRAWIATGYLWFLFYLALYYAMAPLLVTLSSWIVPVVFWIVAVVVPPGPLTDFFFYGGFFFAGNVAARNPGVLAWLVGRRWVVATAAVVAIAFGCVSTVMDVNRMPLLAPLSLLGIVAAIAAMKKVGGTSVLRPIRFVGRNSLVYYVVQIPVMYVVVVVIDDRVEPIAAVAILFLSALVVGTGLSWLRTAIPFRWLFEAPGLSLLRGLPGAGRRDAPRYSGRTYR
ncbi:acyltransferase family protein [Herbiconiux sp. P15]|uniref:acyltransferase family protein n=1 Tax=Herbiconiux liukaitaii TaxID=3342799 RepID=UPI0035B89FAC